MLGCSDICSRAAEREITTDQPPTTLASPPDEVSPLASPRSRVRPDRELPPAASRVFLEASRGYALLREELRQLPPAEQLPAEQLAAVQQIDRDLADRTSVLIRGPDGARSLLVTGGWREACRNVLGAYALYNPGVGYAQGMNFVAAALLFEAACHRSGLAMDAQAAGELQLGEQEEAYAFYLLAGFSEVIYPDLWCKMPQLVGQQVLREIVNKALARLMPELLADPDGQTGIDTALLVLDHLMCALAKSLPLDALVGFWGQLYEVDVQDRTRCTQLTVAAILYIMHRVGPELTAAAAQQPPDLGGCQAGGSDHGQANTSGVWISPRAKCRPAS